MKLLEDKYNELRGPPKEETSPQYAARAVEVIKPDIRAFSGCRDNQTSADVQNVASFGLPAVSGAEAAGGACTNALLAVIQKNGNKPLSYADLIIAMQAELKRRQYSQVPQLSTSHQMDMKAEPFSIWNPRKNGRTKALLIGINYKGMQGELSGCINDSKMMLNFIKSQGFQTTADRLRILADDRSFSPSPPTARNIVDSLRWLVADAQPGDTLFLSYSGHGGQVPDEDGDEKDGMDETLVPVDYQEAGQITDDLLFGILSKMPEGVRLFSVFDCCHSGTILDLPYAFVGTDQGCSALSSGQISFLGANPLFNFENAIKQIQQALSGAGVDDLVSKGREMLKGFGF